MIHTESHFGLTYGGGLKISGDGGQTWHKLPFSPGKFEDWKANIEYWLDVEELTEEEENDLREILL